jgi:hypothetical protein
MDYLRSGPFMKMLRILWILPLAFLLSACPYESKVPLASGPSEPVDTTLLGYWYGIVKDGSDFFGIEALDISKQSDSVYAITRYGKAVKGDIILPDTAYYTGFISYIGEQRFMNIEGSILYVVPRRNKDPEVRTEKVYYLSALNRSHDTLLVQTITENFSPSRRIIKSPSDLTKLVSETLGQQRNIFDEQYTLSYRKIPKPVR